MRSPPHRHEPRVGDTKPASADLHPPHVPEHWNASEDSGQVGLIGNRLEVLAEWNVGNILECLQLNLLCNRLLCRNVWRVQPFAAQSFDLRTVWPAGGSGFAVASQISGRSG